MNKAAQLISIGLVALVLALVMGPLQADALTIAPAYIDRSLNPGDTLVESMQVMNDQSESVTVYPTVFNFTSGDDEQGAPSFYPGNEDPLGTALAKWVTLSIDRLVLAPQQRASVLFTINVPQDAQPGGHYGAVALSSSPPIGANSGGVVGVNYQLAELVLVTVSGEVRERGGVAEFGFDQPKLWYESLPVSFFFRYENSGNTHLRPTGELVITDWLGRRAASIRVNEEYKSVLPMSIRRFQSRWGEDLKDDESGTGFFTGLAREYSHLALGRYKARLYLDDGPRQKVLVGEREFSVWPWRVMVVGTAVAVVLLISLIWLLRTYISTSVRRRSQQSTRDH
jgi:hypothetical protein